MKHFLKNVLGRAAVLTLTAVFCTVLTVTTVQAADDIYIAGNPDMAPFEYYDKEENCYKGILPALYNKLEYEMGVSFVYLPPFQKNMQRTHAKNRQVELVSAHRRWNSEDLTEEFTIYTYQHDKRTYEIAVGFTGNLPADQAEQIRSSIQDLSTDAMLQLYLSQSIPDVHSPHYGPIFISVSMIVVLGAVWYIYRRRQRALIAASQKHLGDWAEYEAAFHALSPAEVQRLCYIGLFTSDLRSLSQKDIQSLQKTTEFLLLRYTRPQESAFKIGNDVFGVILLCDNEALAVHRMEDAITVLNQVSVPGRPSPTRFRGGLYAPHDATVSPELAFERARLAWLLAEKNECPLYLLDQKSLMLEERNQYLRSVLPQALKRKQFRLFLQFIVDADTGAFRGAEALSRWDEPRGGLLRSEIYLPLLQEAQVIDQLDMGIFEQACRLLAQWQNTELKDLWITCNFSHQTLCQKHFPNWFLGIANQFDFPHSQFIVEVSEGIPASNDAIIRKNLRVCKNAGFRIALDDLGRRATTLRDLGAKSLDFVKLDQQFFSNMQTQRDWVVLSDLVQTAHDLDLEVVCETEREIQKAREVGCDYIQSFTYSQVLPHSMAVEFFRKHTQGHLLEAPKQTVDAL